MNRTENEGHLLDVFCRWGQMAPQERTVRLEQVVNAVLKESRQDGYKLDYHESQGLRLYTPGGLILWFVPAENEQRLKVFVVDLTV